MHIPTYFTRRWRGEVAPATLFWRDMVLVGTSVNIACTLGAVVLLSQGVSPWLVAVAHFAALPYNVFLFGAATRFHRHRRLTLYTVGSTLWLVTVSIL